ncbi:MAG: PilW family protein [Pseudomonadota bacterium]
MINRSRGLSMIELLVGLAIGSFIIVGAVMVYSQTRTTYSINETQARLQENGRYALAILEPDLQLAGYYGFSNNASDFRYKAGATETPISQLEQADAALPSPPAGVTTCGNNFAIDLLMTVQGSNNAAGPLTTCAPPTATGLNAGAYQAGTDTVTIRRSSTADAPAATTSRIQLYLNSLKRSNQYVFSAIPANAPGAIDATHKIRNLIVRTYYVATNSRARTNFPTLWRKSLDTDGTNPVILDEEILPGVEDFQVQFGLDTGDHDGIAGVDIDLDNNTVPDNPNGLISRWVAPNSALINSPTAIPAGISAQIVAVRVWLRIRADAPEVSFTDTRTYNYAGVSYTPSGAAAGVRRTLVSRTIYLRNARTL